jgi:hypothetical protein
MGRERTVKNKMASAGVAEKEAALSPERDHDRM